MRRQWDSCEPRVVLNRESPIQAGRLGLPLVYLLLFILDAAIVSRRDRDLYLVVSEYELAHRHSRVKCFSTGPFFNKNWSVAVCVVNFLQALLGIVQLYLTSYVQYQDLFWLVPATVWGCVTLEGALGVLSELLRMAYFTRSDKKKVEFLKFVLGRSDVRMTQVHPGLDKQGSYWKGWDYFHLKETYWLYCVKTLKTFLANHEKKDLSEKQKRRQEKLKGTIDGLFGDNGPSEAKKWFQVQRADLLRLLATRAFDLSKQGIALDKEVLVILEEVFESSMILENPTMIPSMIPSRTPYLPRRESVIAEKAGYLPLQVL